MRISAKHYQQRRSCGPVYFIVIIVIVLLEVFWGGNRALAAGEDDWEEITRVREDRQACIAHYRIAGKLDTAKTQEIESRLKNLIPNVSGSRLSQALFELAAIERMTKRFEKSIANYERCAKTAEALQEKSLLFKAWIGIARSHTYGTRDHGAAEKSFDRAVTIAGNHPSDKQRYDMADYAAQTLVERGELDGALLNGLQAIALSHNDEEKFYAELDTADVLQKYAESCDYCKLIDARSWDDNDPWSACRRAVAAAKNHYGRAEKIARNSGWKFLAKQAAQFRQNLDRRLFLIQQKATLDTMGMADVFHALDVRDVLINEAFEAGGSMLKGNEPFIKTIEMAAPDPDTQDLRDLYLLGLKADVDNRLEEALAYYRKAARGVQQEQTTFFEPRRQGTVLENRVELIQNLGLRLLELRQYNDAFIAFESIRSFGLGALTTALVEIRFTQKERTVLAELVRQASHISALQKKLIFATIADIQDSSREEDIEALRLLSQSYQTVLRRFDIRQLVAKLMSVDQQLPDLDHFHQAVKQAGIPVVFYWVTSANVIVWVITPERHKVKAVFLPEVAVVEKVRRLRESIDKDGEVSFDETAAKELFTYLVKPFSADLSQKQVLIVPQGPLVDLPFETLVDTESGKFWVQETAVSYAPNIAMAIKMLKNPSPVVDSLTALCDETKPSEEILRLKRIKDLDVKVNKAGKLSDEEILRLMQQSSNIHFFLHGSYEEIDPLMSTIKVASFQTTREITATQLLAVDWRSTGLAVFSAYEGPRLHRRISNELFGIPWAVLAGGAGQVVVSRWQIAAVSHAQWMTIFYRSLSGKGASPAIAAAEAMRTMIESKKQNPYYWAGPQVFGT